MNDLSAEQWAAICAAWGGCAYCGAIGPVQKDCMLPVAHGGRYTVANVVPACARCNASKGEAELTSWMRRRRLDESTFLMRRASLLAQLEAAFHADGPSPLAGMPVPVDADPGVEEGPQR